MDRSALREIRERWQAVAEIEAQERRAAPLSLRWQQLNAVLRLAIGLGLPLERSKDEEAVRQRWIRLKGGPR
ncbi:MAG: hypothetical protein ACP5OO_05560 [Chloroflexia bacterium]